MKITMAHGSGGWETSQLIENLFARYFSNPILDRMEDSAVVEGGSRIAFTTDSFDERQSPGVSELRHDPAGRT